MVRKRGTHGKVNATTVGPKPDADNKHPQQQQQYGTIERMMSAGATLHVLRERFSFSLPAKMCLLMLLLLTLSLLLPDAFPCRDGSYVAALTKYKSFGSRPKHPNITTIGVSAASDQHAIEGLDKLLWEDPCNPEAPWPYIINAKTATSSTPSDKSAAHRYQSSKDFHPEWHPRRRADRFPSVEQRIQIYMSNWYVPPHCIENEAGDNSDKTAPFLYRYEGKSEESDVKGSILERRVTISPGPHYAEPERAEESSFPTVATMLRTFRADHIYFFESGVKESSRLNCVKRTKNGTVGVSSPSKCKDIRRLIGVLDQVNSNSNGNRTGTAKEGSEPPILTSPGDKVGLSYFPIFCKTRFSATREEVQKVRSGINNASCDGLSTGMPRKALDTVRNEKEAAQNNDAMFPRTFSPILWNINKKRHFSPKNFQTVQENDLPWQEKLDVAVWRGEVTGSTNLISDQKCCMESPRCRFVLESNNGSPLLNVGFAGELFDSHAFFDKENIGYSLRKEPMNFAEQLRYKMIISLEGNNVASGLKWMLLSNSVVLMSPPTFTSWAMEEWLEPYVHYVPLKKDGSGPEEAVRWVLEHDGEAQKIAERATLFIQDLLYHKDARYEECAVQREVVRRYRAYYASMITA